MRRTLYREGLGEELSVKVEGVLSEDKLEEASAVSIQVSSWEVTGGPCRGIWWVEESQ